MRISLGDFVAYGLIIIAAFGLAARAEVQAGDTAVARCLLRLFSHRLWSYVPLLAALVGGGVYVGTHWNDADDFRDGWPDAIRCTWTHPADAVPSEYVFYYRGHAFNAGLGAVESYFLLGAPPPPAKFHELWLSDENHSIITPDQMPNDPTNVAFTDYKAAFLPGKIDCGGKTVEEMKKSGHAYSFAQRMK
jgi:hypothetical protein